MPESKGNIVERKNSLYRSSNLNLLLCNIGVVCASFGFVPCGVNIYLKLLIV